MAVDSLTQAVEDVAGAFERHKVRYALIGGLAVSIRGRLRSTKDADFIVHSPALTFPGLLEDLKENGFQIDVLDTVRRWSVDKFTVFYRGEVRIDWMQPLLPLYASVISDATPTLWGDGKTIQIATPEGLILTKLVAFRPQDQLDIETLLSANRDTIAADKIRDIWKSLAESYPDRTAWLEALIAKHVTARS